MQMLLPSLTDCRPIYCLWSRALTLTSRTFVLYHPLFKYYLFRERMTEASSGFFWVFFFLKNQGHILHSLCIVCGIWKDSTSKASLMSQRDTAFRCCADNELFELTGRLCSFIQATNTFRGRYILQFQSYYFYIITLNKTQTIFFLS